MQPHQRSTLYIQVLAAILLGVAVGYASPETGHAMKPLADGFIKLIRLMVGPIIFCSIVHGIAGLPSLRDAGRIGSKALLYFTGLSAISLLLGVLVANLLKPGAGLHVRADQLDTSGLSQIAHGPQSLSEFMLSVIPTSFIEPFATNNILQIVVIALLVASALLVMGLRARPIITAIEQTGQLFFTLMYFIMRLAPLGAFGAMAYTVGTYGVASLLPLGQVLLCFYLTAALFVFIGLAIVMRIIGLPLLRFLIYIREEIFVTLGTSSSEAALPRLITKLEKLGCERRVVGLVLPTGYSFNLDGTAIYLSLAALFLAQATDTPLTLGQQLGMLAVMMITSKGAAGVTGAGFITLSATLASVGHIPVASLALILGIDRFMSEGRAATNIIGNAVATLAIARWEGALDLKRAGKVLTQRRTAKPRRK